MRSDSFSLGRSLWKRAKWIMCVIKVVGWRRPALELGRCDGMPLRRERKNARRKGLSHGYDLTRNKMDNLDIPPFLISEYLKSEIDHLQLRKSSKRQPKACRFKWTSIYLHFHFHVMCNCINGTVTYVFYLHCKMYSVECKCVIIS
jgi:hypothetical protein